MEWMKQILLKQSLKTGRDHDPRNILGRQIFIVGRFDRYFSCSLWWTYFSRKFDPLFFSCAIEYLHSLLSCSAGHVMFLEFNLPSMKSIGHGIGKETNWMFRVNTVNILRDGGLRSPRVSSVCVTLIVWWISLKNRRESIRSPRAQNKVYPIDHIRMDRLRLASKQQPSCR